MANRAKDGIVTRDVLTRKWTDWIDYWSVDFDFESKREILRVKNPENGETGEVWSGDYIIQNWMRNRNRIEFLRIWEQLNNPDFNSIEFDGIRKQAGLNSFLLTPKRWINATGGGRDHCQNRALWRYICP